VSAFVQGHLQLRGLGAGQVGQPPPPPPPPIVPVSAAAAVAVSTGRDKVRRSGNEREPEFGAAAGATGAHQGTGTLLSAMLNTFAKGSVSGGLKGAVERASQLQMFAVGNRDLSETSDAAAAAAAAAASALIIPFVTTTAISGANAAINCPPAPTK
jgi:hypothetical protein